MKILLVRSHDDCDINTRLPHSLNRVRGVLPPLGIAYIAAVLEKSGHEVKILDAMALNLTSAEMRQNIKKERPDIVGVTAMTPSIRGALEVLRWAKEAGSITIIGGAHLAVYPAETLSYDFVDFGIIGEGEYPFRDLVRAIEEKTPLKNVAGLVYKEDNQVRVGEAYIHPDLDEIPFPARHLLPMTRYSSIISILPMATMVSGRGCPYRCGFCFKGPSDRKYRVRSPGNVVDEMELIVKDFKVREIMFYDDTLTLERTHVEGICNEILSRGLKVRWESPTRVDSVDPELLKLMRRAGCVRLRYGVESGDPSILKLMNKGIDLQQVKKVFNWTKKAGIETFAYFMIGYIHETPETAGNTISFAQSLDPDFAMFTVTIPYPKTPLYDMARSEGLITGDYWREFVLGRRDDSISYLVPDAEQWTRKAYRSFYFRPGYIMKMVLKIRSWNDINRYFEAATGLLRFKMKSNDDKNG